MRFPVFDLHCDTAFALLDKQGTVAHSLLRNSLQFDLERASCFPGYVQCFACFTSDSETLVTGMPPAELFRCEYEAAIAGFRSFPEYIGQAFTMEDILENRRKGIISGILTIEGTAGFQYDPDALAQLYQQGFRITTLGWNEKNPLAGSHATGGGLTPRGAAYVKEAQRLGMLVDVSHASDETFWDIIKITQAPIIASHSNSRSIWNVSRNLTDDMFRAIIDTNGVVGINLYQNFLGENADLHRACDHVLHFMTIDPSCRHICLGGDLDGCDLLPTDFNGVQDYPKLADTLSIRGLSDELIYNIFWNNAVRLFEKSYGFEV